MHFSNFVQKYFGEWQGTPITGNKDIKNKIRKKGNFINRRVRNIPQNVFQTILCHWLPMFFFGKKRYRAKFSYFYFNSHYLWKILVSLRLYPKGNSSVQINCNKSLHLSPSSSASRRKHRQWLSFISAFQPKRVLLGDSKCKSYSKILLVCDWPCKLVCCNPFTDVFPNFVAEISWWEENVALCKFIPLLLACNK